MAKMTLCDCLPSCPLAKDAIVTAKSTREIERLCMDCPSELSRDAGGGRVVEGASDIRTTLDIYTHITDPEAARMVNRVTNRVLGLGEEVVPGSVH
jgi:hypothetical protein